MVLDQRNPISLFMNFKVVAQLATNITYASALKSVPIIGTELFDNLSGDLLNIAMNGQDWLNPTLL